MRYFAKDFNLCLHKASYDLPWICLSLNWPWGRVHLLYDLRIYSTPLYMSPPNKQAYIIEYLDQNIQVYWWRRWKHHLPVFSRYGRWNYQSRNCEVIDETISSSFPVFLFLRILKRFQKGRPPAVFVFVQSRALAWRQRGKNSSNLYVCHCIFVFVCAYLYLCICICKSCICETQSHIEHWLSSTIFTCLSVRMVTSPFREALMEKKR